MHDRMGYTVLSIYKLLSGPGAELNFLDNMLHTEFADRHFYIVTSFIHITYLRIYSTHFNPFDRQSFTLLHLVYNTTLLRNHNLL
jgi:hypothetical protein